jgi:uncharacterized tellurite resistance protein B-like protein
MTHTIRKRAIKAEHFANLVAIAYADDILDDYEKSFLSERAEEIGLNTDEVRSMLSNADELKVTVPLNQEEVEEQIADIVYMIMVDGEIHEKEYKLCLSIAKKLDYSQTELDHMIELIKKLWKK